VTHRFAACTKNRQIRRDHEAGLRLRRRISVLPLEAEFAEIVVPARRARGLPRGLPMNIDYPTLASPLAASAAE